LTLQLCVASTLFPAFGWGGDPHGAPASSTGQSGPGFYIVNKNETLGEILERLNYSPLWGSHGFVRQTWLLNQDQIEREGDLIYPGTAIRLPMANRQLASEQTAGPMPTGLDQTAGNTGPLHAKPESTAVWGSQRESDVLHSLSLSLGYGLESLSGSDPVTGAAAKLISSRDVHLGVSWSQAWSKSFTSFFRFSLDSVEFEQSSNPDKSIANPSVTPVSLGVGSIFRLGRFEITPELGYGDALFMRGFNSSTLTIDSVPELSAGVSLSIELYRQTSTRLGLTGSADFLGHASTDSYSVNNGSRFSGGAYLEKSWGAGASHALRFDLSYESQNQNTSIVNQSGQAVLGIITFRFPFLGAGSDPEAKP
jgi:hypothetical protein